MSRQPWDRSLAGPSTFETPLVRESLSFCAAFGCPRRPSTFPRASRRLPAAQPWIPTWQTLTNSSSPPCPRPDYSRPASKDFSLRCPLCRSSRLRHPCWANSSPSLPHSSKKPVPTAPKRPPDAESRLSWPTQPSTPSSIGVLAPDVSRAEAGVSRYASPSNCPKKLVLIPNLV